MVDRPLRMGSANAVPNGTTWRTWPSFSSRLTALKIVGHLTRSAFVEEAEYGRVFDAYREEFIAGLDIDRWREEHESLRIEGALGRCERRPVPAAAVV